MILVPKIRIIIPNQGFLTVASISVTRVTRGSKLRISTTRWGRRSKTALKTPPEFYGEHFKGHN